MKLSQEQIKLLLVDDDKPKYPPTPQRGPLRFVDNSLKCTSRNCGCASYIKVDGIPSCSMHALQRLNELVITLTDRLEASYGRQHA